MTIPRLRRPHAARGRELPGPDKSFRLRCQRFLRAPARIGPNASASTGHARRTPPPRKPGPGRIFRRCPPRSRWPCQADEPKSARATSSSKNAGPWRVRPTEGIRPAVIDKRARGLSRYASAAPPWNLCAASHAAGSPCPSGGHPALLPVADRAAPRAKSTDSHAAAARRSPPHMRRGARRLGHEWRGIRRPPHEICRPRPATGRTSTYAARNSALNVVAVSETCRSSGGRSSKAFGPPEKSQSRNSRHSSRLLSATSSSLLVM